MKYDQRTNRLKTFNASISDGPISAFVKENQNLWFACSDGIFIINTQNDEISFYDKPNNLCQSGIYLPHSHRIVWGGENGISTYLIKTKKKVTGCILPVSPVIAIKNASCFLPKQRKSG